MKEDAAEFERAWMDAWNYAAPELKRIRQDELKELDNVPAPATSDFNQSGVKSEEVSGLVVFQQWMMRWRVLLLMEEVAKLES